MPLKNISNFFGAISLRSVDTTQTDVNFIHHAFEILNYGVKSLSYGVKPLRDQSETNIVILINISTSLDSNFFMKYASCFTVKGESRNIMIYMHSTTNLYSKVLILLMNATNDTYLLYKLMPSLLWEEISVLRLQSSQDAKCCFFWEEKTHTSPYLGFKLLIRVSLSRKTLPIAFSVARITCVLLYFSL